MKNEVVEFNNRYLQEFEKLRNLAITKKKIEEREKKIKSDLQSAMEEFGIDKIENSYLKIVKIADSESVTLDVKKLEKEEFDLYSELLCDYPKVTKKAAYLRFTVK